MRKVPAVVQARRTVIQCKGIKVLGEKRPSLYVARDVGPRSVSRSFAPDLIPSALVLPA
jgi:hypothetical protein